jgi:hypothetical protein
MGTGDVSSVGSRDDARSLRSASVTSLPIASDLDDRDALASTTPAHQAGVMHDATTTTETMRPLPLIVSLHAQLQAEWLELVSREGSAKASADAKILTRICAAWPEPFDIELIRTTRGRVPYDGRGMLCTCGGWGVMPMWASSAFESGFDANLFEAPAGDSPVRCERCDAYASRLETKNAVPCPICRGHKIVPSWVTNATLGSPSLTWQQHSGAGWMPTPCVACGASGSIIVDEAAEPPPPVLQIVREAGVVSITYSGITVTLEERLGLLYIIHLLAIPHRTLHVRELVAHAQRLTTPAFDEAALREAGLRPTGRVTTGTVTDHKALKAYRRRLEELDSALDDAKGRNDAGRVEALDQEREALLKEIAAASGPGGELRKLADDNERARKAVRKAITEAISEIASVHRGLAEHLEQCIKTGMECSYSPPVEMVWDVRL